MEMKVDIEKYDFNGLLEEVAGLVHPNNVHLSGPFNMPMVDPVRLQAVREKLVELLPLVEDNN
jgi:hypothetical protein